MDISQETSEPILKSCETVDQLKGMSNFQIAKLLKEHIWSEINVFSPKSDLLGEAIERLEKLDERQAKKEWLRQKALKCTDQSKNESS